MKRWIVAMALVLVAVIASIIVSGCCVEPTYVERRTVVVTPRPDPSHVHVLVPEPVPPKSGN